MSGCEKWKKKNREAEKGSEASERRCKKENAHEKEEKTSRRKLCKCFIEVKNDIEVF